jgi:uncharacterized protein DUF5719
MTEKLREGGFGLLLALFVLGGVGFSAIAGDVEPAPAPSFSGDLVDSKAVFCAPSSAAEGTVRVALAPTSDDPIRVGLEPAAPVALTRQPEPSPVVELDAGRARITAVEGNKPTDAVGYGGFVAGSTLVSTAKPLEGVGAAACSADVSTQWYFAAGSTALGADERILLYNPFPDEAVVRLNFYTPQGLETKTSVSDVPVPAGSWESVAINKVIRAQGSVAVEVSAARGRVVAWREMFSRPDEAPSGLQLTLGATETAPEWYFADGAIGEGFDEKISIVNPNPRRAVVEITLTTNKRTLQPADLMDLTLPGRTSATFSLGNVRSGLGGVTTGVGAIVRSKNGVGVVAERTVRYDSGEAIGTTAEVGIREPGKKWMLGPPAASPATDAIALLNPGPEAATVDILLLSDAEEPLELGQLQDIEVKPATRLKFAIDQLTEGQPLVAVVTSSQPVVAERWAYSSANEDAAAVMGIPLRPRP